MGRRQSWRAGAGCKPVAFGLSEFESHPPHHKLIIWVISLVVRQQTVNLP